MGARKFGKAAVAAAAVSVLLAVGDYRDYVDRAALFLGIPVKVVPIVYISLFGLAWLLQRYHYESADYGFVVDPENEYAFEEASFSEFYRITVENRGHVPITVSVF